MAEKKLTGKIARERIRSMETPLCPEGVIEGFRALGDASGIVSDVMDELGITGIIGASVLKPTIPGSCVVGPALTVRNIIQRIAGIRVAPGDVVLADDTGVCFIPRVRAREVLELAKQKSAKEEAKCKAIDAGVPVADLPA
ncbi:MAG TPA: hypothetical protein VGW77_07130 [Candidatus Binatia bacterium]|nr:hypothetical protein [Candidatus Binatia bacterium]